MEEVLKESVLSNPRMPYQMIELQKSHIPEVIHLQNIVIQNLENSNDLVPLSKQELLAVTGSQGYCIGIRVGEDLVGFHAMLFPDAEDEENLGYDLGLGTEERQAVAHLESVFVHPHFRGNGLQKKMTYRLLDYLKSKKQHHYVFETIAPTNFASLNSSLAGGLHIHLLKSKYGGVLRYILFRDLTNPTALDRNTIKIVRSEDHDLQRSLFESGYRGFYLTKDKDSSLIHFACPLS